MSDKITFSIDGKECTSRDGMYLVDAATENRVYIPTLCNYPGLKPKGSCRICTVKVNGRLMTACTTPVTRGMQIENDTGELNDMRKQIIEVLLVSGNHFCPACEKSGDCELQALAYRFGIMAPRFPFTFPQKSVDASHPKIIKEQNRCILCKRCVRAIKDEQGRSIFAHRYRSHKLEVVVDPKLGAEMSWEKAKQAMDICPVGSILLREQGFSKPIGTRKYDLQPIGSDIEKPENE
jgi:[NiFe] hydrogenase diaphorase moiety small subunit